MAAIPNESTNTRSLLEGYAEAQRYFMGEGILNNALAELAARLTSHGIDYVVIGAVALKEHGYERVTENIDLVLTAEGVAKFNKKLLGRGGLGLEGYDQVTPGSSKRLRTFPGGVSINVMITGDYPGDGKPKPVTMPEPFLASIEIDGVRFVTLEKLIELKLASGMAASDRLKDLADVQELIKIRGLGPEFATQLDPYVRGKFLELYETIRQSPKDEAQERNEV
jgi:hypothetical protein